MGNLANAIEVYIKRLLAASPNATLLLQRKELAERFQCVPSQINYVLATRFTAGHGYLVESRRGEGGYLRIKRLDLNKERVNQLLSVLNDLKRKITVNEALGLIDRLADARIVTRRENEIMKAALTQGLRAQNQLLSNNKREMLVEMLEVLLKDS
ncbi:MAG: CtsR family transcriptional regulator [Firmicutes bacterium]|nr:CtsR family transcriptional regulator [Bacillota bacterium]